MVSGGYGLNCVANYYYLETLREKGIKMYVEPVSNDAGTAMGAPMMFWYGLEDETKKAPNTNFIFRTQITIH